ncbi:hypothetical protein OS493_003397 [Desmophyllum pertusum]|uniref:UPAR/Ly6 domain-containing protein n=1 Tax=Desmophyllum pertusum TaxID=174260 RepID=A0A9X0A5D6_9CNID|nr:hypothetical protein OS493_003397 [Desmophyllum pertusum]
MGSEVTNRFVLLTVALFLPLTVSGLKCYHCLSSSSMADCGKSSKKMTCPDIADNCANISTEVMSDSGSLKSYFYGCATRRCARMPKNSLKCAKISTREVTKSSVTSLVAAEIFVVQLFL